MLYLRNFITFLGIIQSRNNQLTLSIRNNLLQGARPQTGCASLKLYDFVLNIAHTLVRQQIY